MNKSMTIVRQEVCRLLGGDTSGHSDEHVERVARLAERFANEYKKEAASMDEVLLTAWLHDVDDYKLGLRRSERQRAKRERQAQ